MWTSYKCIWKPGDSTGDVAWLEGGLFWNLIGSIAIDDSIGF